MAGLVELRMHDAVEVALGVNGMAPVGQTTFKPVDGPTAALRLTEPAKLKVLVRETVMDEPEVPVLILPELAEIVKSPTWMTAEVDCEKDPGEPVATIVTLYVPGVVELRAHFGEMAALAESGVAMVEQVMVRPAEEVPVNVTVPEKLLVLVIKTVIAPAAPELKSAGVFVDTLKPPTLLVNVVLRVSPPPMAIMLTVKVPGVVDVGWQVPVTGVVPLTLRVLGQPGLRPVPGEVDVAIVMVPVNPLVGVMVMVELPEAPELKSAGDVAKIEKSGAKVTYTEREMTCVSLPLVAYTWTK
jgi:hypothetical protein